MGTEYWWLTRTFFRFGSHTCCMFYFWHDLPELVIPVLCGPVQLLAKVSTKQLRNWNLFSPCMLHHCFNRIFWWNVENWTLSHRSGQKPLSSFWYDTSNKTEKLAFQTSLTNFSFFLHIFKPSAPGVLPSSHNHGPLATSSWHQQFRLTFKNLVG